MDNHCHPLVETPEANLSTGMHNLEALSSLAHGLRPDSAPEHRVDPAPRMPTRQRQRPQSPPKNKNQGQAFHLRLNHRQSKA